MTSVRSVRIEDDAWERLGREAKAAGVSRNAHIASLLEAPSFSQALEVVSIVRDRGGIEDVLALADDPKLAAVTRSDLRDLGKQLQALGARWPR